MLSYSTIVYKISDVPRRKLSEYKSKKIVSVALGLPYQGWSIDSASPLEDQLIEPMRLNTKLVVKVDEGVKKRFKNGLVILNVLSDDLAAAIHGLSSKGYRYLIIEPMVDHSDNSEMYLSIISDRNKTTLQFTDRGGVDVEDHANEIQRAHLGPDTNWTNISEKTRLSEQALRNLVAAFNDNYFTFLEINPYLVDQTGIKLLDTAVEVDDAGEFFVQSWNASDFRRHTDQKITPEELLVDELDTKSPASFKLSVLNPDGGIFLLLSGGGASVVVADEIYNQNHGLDLANYGEYSGNPNTEETYTYTKAVLDLLLASKATRKVLFIGGAVANFTDIAKTFQGVVQAISESADKLKEQNVKVFVRRGGPNQEKGLKIIRDTLAKYDLLGAVHDPSTSISDAVGEALREFENA